MTQQTKYNITESKKKTEFENLDTQKTVMP